MFIELIGYNTLININSISSIEEKETYRRPDLPSDARKPYDYFNETLNISHAESNSIKSIKITMNNGTSYNSNESKDEFLKRALNNRVLNELID